MNKPAITYIYNKIALSTDDQPASVEAMSQKNIKQVRKFHQSFPQYKVTPLVSLVRLAKELDVNKIWVKDEAHRFGLNAFKVLGASFAMGKYLSDRLEMAIEDLTFEQLQSDRVKKKLGGITFVTATDGNHGRGVAWAAQQLGQKSVVFMPKDSAQVRLQNIQNEGAVALITDCNYDDTVKLATKYAQENNGVLMQDTAWPGYEKVPLWIMQGYGTIIDEALAQINEQGHPAPTHVFLQAGVGTFAAAIQAYLTAKYGKQGPVTAIIEPTAAACFYQSAQLGDGQPHGVTGDLATIMAGLACGVPNPQSWSILRDYAKIFVMCPDYVAARGVRILGNPMPGDPQIISGESGAVGLGLLSLITQKEGLKQLKDLLKINQETQILLINTEGDTDPAHYRKIVWDGASPSS